VRRILRYALSLPNQAEGAARISPFEGAYEFFFRQIGITGCHE
jgi:hypothetical protein